MAKFEHWDEDEDDDDVLHTVYGQESRNDHEQLLTQNDEVSNKVTQGDEMVQEQETAPPELSVKEKLQMWYEGIMPSLQEVYGFEKPKDFQFINEMSQAENGDFIININTVDDETFNIATTHDLPLSQEKMAMLIDSIEPKTDRDMPWLMEIQDLHERLMEEPTQVVKANRSLGEQLDADVVQDVVQDVATDATADVSHDVTNNDEGMTKENDALNVQEALQDDLPDYINVTPANQAKDTFAQAFSDTNETLNTLVQDVNQEENNQQIVQDNVFGSHVNPFADTAVQSHDTPVMSETFSKPNGSGKMTEEESYAELTNRSYENDMGENDMGVSNVLPNDFGGNAPTNQGFFKDTGYEVNDFYNNMPRLELPYDGVVSPILFRTMKHFQDRVDSQEMGLGTVMMSGRVSYAHLLSSHYDENVPYLESQRKDSIWLDKNNADNLVLPYEYEPNKFYNVPLSPNDLEVLYERYHAVKESDYSERLTPFEEAFWDVHVEPDQLVQNIEQKKQQRMQENQRDHAEEVTMQNNGTPADGATPPADNPVVDNTVTDAPTQSNSEPVATNDTSTPADSPDVAEEAEPLPTNVQDLAELQGVHNRGKYGGFDRPSELVQYMHKQTNQFYDAKIDESVSELAKTNYKNAKDAYNMGYEMYRNRVDGNLLNENGEPSHEMDAESMALYDALTYRTSRKKEQTQENTQDNKPDEEEIRREEATSDFARIIAENMSKLLEETARKQLEIVKKLKEEKEQTPPDEYDQWLEENHERLHTAEQLASSVQSLAGRIQMNSDRAEDLTQAINDSTGQNATPSESAVEHMEIDAGVEQNVQEVVETVQELTGQTPEQAEPEGAGNRLSSDNDSTATVLGAGAGAGALGATADNRIELEPPTPRFNSQEAQAINEVKQAHIEDFQQIRNMGSHLSENPNNPRMAMRIHQDATELMSLMATPPAMMSDEKKAKMQELTDRFEQIYAPDPENTRDTKWTNSAYKALVKNEDKSLHDVAIINKTAEALQKMQAIQNEHRAPEEQVSFERFSAFNQELQQRSQANSNHAPNPYMQVQQERQQERQAQQEQVSTQEQGNSLVENVRRLFGR